MNSKTKKLNALFEEWEDSDIEYKGKFTRDGIINEELFNSQELKILFLAKEPNDIYQSGWDYREWWSQEVKYSFSIRISEWAYGLLNNFPILESVPSNQEDRIESLKKVAFMNLRKIGGSSNVNNITLEKTIEKDKYFILNQIEIIDPDIIIGSIGYSSFWEILFKDFKLLSSGYDIRVGKYENIKIIDFYHPSYRIPRSAFYCLLKEIYMSQAFNQI